MRLETQAAGGKAVGEIIWQDSHSMNRSTRLDVFQRIPCALAITLIALAQGAEPKARNPPVDPARQVREYRDFAMGHDGSPARGRELFNNEQRAACVKCHSVDATSSQAGPDLFAAGDKLP